jgi:ABC-type antimicrobial peptide transport system permease subunit
VAALFAGRLVASQLYALEPYDPATLVLPIVALAAAALAAGAVPARRAASIDPLVALKAD